MSTEHRPTGGGRPGQSSGTSGKLTGSGKGASQSRTRIVDRLASYLSHHRLVARESLSRLLAAPIATVMTWLVIGIAMALPTGLFVALGNVEAISGGWDGAAQMSLFIDKSVSEPEAKVLAEQLGGRADIEEVVFISSAQALTEFQELSGFGDVLQNLDANPLPSVIVIRPRQGDDAAVLSEALFGELKELPEVAEAVLDLQWVQRLYAMMDLGRRLTLALAGMLSLGVLLVIGNTIRLAIEGRRDEIVIVKLVGATNAFVRRPFLYTGLWYGLGGGLTAWFIIGISLLWLRAPVAQLAGLYQSGFDLQGLGIGASLLLWMVSAGLGLLGAWLAVGRHLGAIEPR